MNPPEAFGIGIVAIQRAWIFWGGGGDIFFNPLTPDVN